MANYKPNPTYYRVEWNQGSPNNYSSLTGTQAGGLDSSSSLDYNSKVTVTGDTAITGTPMVTGDALVINEVGIAFVNTDTLADIITTINMHRVLTNVIAHNDISATYITLTNALGNEAEPITLAEGTGALAKLGIAEGVYTHFPSVVGGSFTSFTNGDNVDINGVTITFTTAGGLNRAGAITTINSYTASTHVIASAAAGKVQLTSTVAQPIVVAGANPTKLGFTAGVYGGSPSTLAQSTNKALANLRFNMVMMQLEQFATPFILNDFFGTGNYDGSAALSTFAFTVGYERPDQVATLAPTGEPDAGELLTGTAAVKRAVARGLAATYNSNVNLFDPTTEVKNGCAIRPNPVRVVNLTATGISTDLADLEDNITVTIIVLE
jgi:hypothetical protein